MKKLFVAISLTLLAGLGCSSEEASHDKMAEVVVEEIPKEIQIPTKLWDFIEGKANPDEKPGAHHEEAHAEAAEGDGHGGAAAAGGDVDAGSSGALFTPVDVILTEKNAGILTESPLRIRLPRGGGTIDLSQYTTEKPGSFFVRFEWPDQEEGTVIESWFVSKARQRRLGAEMWGAGCKEFFRITKGLAKAQAGEGLKVNTTRLRHLTVLGGHFIFSSRKSGQTSVSQVTFKDSRFPNFFCEGF